MNIFKLNWSHFTKDLSYGDISFYYSHNIKTNEDEFFRDVRHLISANICSFIENCDKDGFMALENRTTLEVFRNIEPELLKLGYDKVEVQTISMVEQFIEKNDVLASLIDDEKIFNKALEIWRKNHGN